MEKLKFNKGDEVLYYSGDIEYDTFCKAYFMFPTEVFGKIQDENKWKYPEAIIAKKIEDVNRYDTLEDFRTAQTASDDFVGNDSFIFVDDIKYIKKYSKKNENRAENFYNFCRKNESIYNYMLKFSSLFLDEKNSFCFSTLFYNFRKNTFAYRVRFIINILYLLFKGIIKIIFCPIKFIIDIMLSSLESYIEFKKSKNRLNFYSTRSFERKMAYMGLKEEDFEKEKQKYKDELVKQKTNYINSNVAVFTLLIAFMSFLFSMCQTSRQNFETSQKIDTYKSEIEKLNKKNEELSTELKIERLKSDSIKIEEKIDILTSTVEEIEIQLKENIIESHNK